MGWKGVTCTPPTYQQPCYFQIFHVNISQKKNMLTEKKLRSSHCSHIILNLTEALMKFIEKGLTFRICCLIIVADFL